MPTLQGFHGPQDAEARASTRVIHPSHIVALHMQLQTRAGFSGRMQRMRSLEVTSLSPKSIFVPEYSRQAYWPRWLILACDLDLNGTLTIKSPTIHGDTDCYECQRGLCMVIYCTKQRKKMFGRPATTAKLSMRVRKLDPRSFRHLVHFQDKLTTKMTTVVRSCATSGISNI